MTAIRPPLVVDTLVGLGGLSPQGASALNVVVCDDVASYHDAMVDDGRNMSEAVDGMRVRPPFAATWLEWSSTDHPDGHPRQANAAGVTFLENKDLALRDIQAACTKGSDIAPESYAARHDCMLRLELMTVMPGGLVLAGMMWVGVRHDGTVPSYSAIDHMYTEGVLPEQEYILNAMYSNGTLTEEITRTQHSVSCRIALFALGMLNSKSSSLVPHQSPRHDRRARLKAGYSGLKVSELVVNPIKQCVAAIAEHRSVAGAGAPLPSHLCRGHFKTYTAEAPLMGKHVGTYWWDPHFRGSEVAGKVEHPIVRVAI